MESISSQLHFSCDESTEQLLLPLKAPEEDEVEKQEAVANLGAATETCMFYQKCINFLIELERKAALKFFFFCGFVFTLLLTPHHDSVTLWNQ